MYLPDPFRLDETDALDLIEAYPFGVLVSCEADQPVATHLPFLLDRAAPDGSAGQSGGGSGDGADRPAPWLTGHVARANPHWASLAEGAAEGHGVPVLAIFSGPHGYVSPTWYGRGPAVPTWNYGAVHVYGTLQTFDEPARLAAAVARLSARFEGGAPAAPATARWTPDALPDGFHAAMLEQIGGLKIRIERIEGKAKLSQNRPAADRRQVIRTLADSARPEDRLLAGFMSQLADPDR